MNRPRKHNKHLPARVYINSAGVYYFVDRSGKWHRLGKSYPDAMYRYAELLQDNQGRTLGHVMDRYIREVIPGKAPRTRSDNLIEIRKLRAVFGHMRPEQVRPQHVYQYMDRRPKIRGRRERALLSHVFTKAIEWGHADANPCRQVHVDRIPRRDRYVEDHEFRAVYELASPLIRVAMDLAYLTALRKGDLLALTWHQVSEDGIAVRTGKTGKRMMIERSVALSEALQAAKSLPSGIGSLWVLHTRKGQPVTESGFNSMWQRLQRKYAAMGGERFRFHDLRRKAATDAERLHGREFARQLLSHDDQKTTAGYVSGVQKVRPIR